MSSDVYESFINTIRAEAWDEGWHEHFLEEVRQASDASHPITNNNPYRKAAGA